MIVEILQWIAISVLALFLLGCVLAVMVIPWAIWKVRKEREPEKLPFHCMITEELCIMPEEPCTEWLDRNAKGRAFYWKATQGAYSRSGIPDICVIIGGRFYGLEVKRPFFGVVSSNQKKVKREIETIGGKVYIVTYVKEVEEILLPVLERREQ